MSENTKIAVISLISAVVVGTVTNWDRIFPESGKTETRSVIEAETDAREERARAEAMRAKAEAERIMMELEEKKKQEERARKQAIVEEKSKQFADAASHQIVKKYWIGGSNISNEVNGASFDEATNRYEISIRLHWYGMFFSSNEYWATGKLTVEPDGSFNFVKTDGSSSLSEVEDNKSGLEFGAVLGVLAIAASK
jgi:hypothetical protein